MFPILPVDYPEWNADHLPACCVYLLITSVSVDELAPLSSRGLLFSRPINMEDTFNLGAHLKRQRVNSLSVFRARNDP